jgi:CheY-like chemotaxis protein/anti-sigma regulatory factor (Ser/Thr protein kinase)
MRRILIVDDNPMDRVIASAAVSADGTEVLLATNGFEALEMIQLHHPNLVLTDLEMPELNGLELVRRIRRSYPELPVILMTGNGSEEIAVAALTSGASSYVPKRSLKVDLPAALEIVLSVTVSHEKRKRIFQIMSSTDSCFEVGYDRDAPSAVVRYFQETLRMMTFCDESDLLRVGTAIGEAIANARDHGNLELSSTVRDSDDPCIYERMRIERSQRSPYLERRVFIRTSVTANEAACEIRDEGPGFDPSTLPDPTDPEAIMRAHGRGLLLIRSFMDEVRFNDSGNQITMIKRRAPSMSTPTIEHLPSSSTSHLIPLR